MKYFPQYNREFICTDVKSKYHNDVHSEVIGAKCYPAFVKEGERAWILINTGDPYPHRLHTSTVIGTHFEEIWDDDDKTLTGYKFTVETRNSEYVFETKY